MPHIAITMYPGRDADTKMALAKKMQLLNDGRRCPMALWGALGIFLVLFTLRVGGEPSLRYPFGLLFQFVNAPEAGEGEHTENGGEHHACHQ